MEFLSEDPTFLAGGLGILGLLFVIALWLTQQGKFLMWALGSWGLALLVIGVEWLWVTDRERIEHVVYDLKRAVAASDAEGVLVHLTPDVQFAVGTRTAREMRQAPMLRRLDLATGALTRKAIKSELEQCAFDVVRITRLETQVSRQSRRGTANFRVLVSGRYRDMVGTSPSDWSLGFVETSPKVWQVDRISPTALPNDIVLEATGGAPPNASGFPVKPPFRMPGGSP